MSTLIISEKNKAAQAIAEALGPTTKIQVNKLVKVYHVPSRDIFVLPLRGHIQQYENTAAYKKWTAKDPRDIITDPNAIAKIPTKFAGPYISALKKYGKLCTTCVVGTDADVEGCVIGLLDAVPFVTAVNPKIRIMQIWLNDLQKSSIRTAYQNLISPKWSWAYSGEARAQLDAIIGFSATREVSLTLKPILQGINVKFTSIGRVQTSLLYLIYLREDIIRNFKPSPFWTISAKLKIGGSELKVNHVKNNFTDKKIAEGIYSQIKNEKSAILEAVQTKTRKINPPVPLNTSKALQLITRNLKINAKVALKTLEDLYLNKLITYPRTDSDVYSPTYDHKATLQKFLTHSIYGQFTRDLFKNKRIIPTKGKHDTGDHSPITPLQSLEPSASKFGNKLQQQVYNLIARYYLALFGEPAEESNTRILVSIKNEKFMGQTKVLLKKGFYTIAPFLSPRYGAPLPSLPSLHGGTSSTGNSSSVSKPVLPVIKIDLDKKETQPPPRYSDTTLLQLMERKKLGTKSTRPAIIQILIDRSYIQRQGRSIFLMDLGFLLIDSLVTIWKPFLDPGFTANVEKNLEGILNKKLQMPQVVDAIKKDFLRLFDLFRVEKPKILQKMQALQTTGNVIRGRNNKILSGKATSKGGSHATKATNTKGGAPASVLTSAKCPKCKTQQMKLVVSTHNKAKIYKFLVCNDPNCKTYLSLPKKGTPHLMKSICKICNFNIVKIST
ncbi:MAG: DNA topoisomerase, partial [Promethearchaeota archaeon]